jgi:hypothetical protein
LNSTVVSVAVETWASFARVASFMASSSAAFGTAHGLR